MGFFQILAHKIAAILAIFTLSSDATIIKPASLPVSESIVESIERPVAKVVLKENIKNERVATIDAFKAPVVSVKIEQPEASLVISGIQPSTIVNTDVNTVKIIGIGFQKGLTVRVGDRYVDVSDTISPNPQADGVFIKIPVNFSAGTYRVGVFNPNGKSSILNNALVVNQPSMNINTDQSALNFPSIVTSSQHPSIVSAPLIIPGSILASVSSSNYINNKGDVVYVLAVVKDTSGNLMLGQTVIFESKNSSVIGVTDMEGVARVRYVGDYNVLADYAMSVGGEVEIIAKVLIPGTINNFISSKTEVRVSYNPARPQQGHLE